MSSNQLPPIRASHVVAPNAFTTVLGVQFEGSPTLTYYRITAMPIPVPKLGLALLGRREAPALHVSIWAHAVLRQQCYTFEHILDTEVGQRIVCDFVLALSRLDGPRIMQISAYLSRRTASPRTAPPAAAMSVPGEPVGRSQKVPLPPATRTPRQHAVELLTAAGRADDTMLVEEVAARFALLPVREQAAAGQAIRAIIDAFTYLGRLTATAPDGLARSRRAERLSVWACVCMALGSTLTE